MGIYFPSTAPLQNRMATKWKSLETLELVEEVMTAGDNGWRCFPWCGWGPSTLLEVLVVVESPEEPLWWSRMMMKWSCGWIPGFRGRDWCGRRALPTPKMVNCLLYSLPTAVEPWWTLWPDRGGHHNHTMVESMRKHNHDSMDHDYGAIHGLAVVHAMKSRSTSSEVHGYGGHHI